MKSSVQTNRPLRVTVNTGIYLLLFACGIGAFTNYLISREVPKIAGQRNFEFTDLVARVFDETAKQSISTAKLISTEKFDPGALAHFRHFISAAVIEWNGESIAYQKRADNTAFLREHDIEGRAITESLTLFQNELTNLGPGFEQVFGTILGNEVPALVFVAPLKLASATETQYSIVAIVDATDLLRLMTKTAGNLTYLVDRFGTTLLHPEYDRSLHRESNINNLLLKAFILKGANRYNDTVYDSTLKSDVFGAVVRASFGEIGVVTQVPAATINSPIQNILITIGMAALLGFLVLTMIAYIVQRNRGRNTEPNVVEKSQEQLELIA